MANQRDREQRERNYSDAGAWAKKQTEGFTPTCVRFPKGFESFKPGPGTYQVDFFCYWTGQGNPNCDPDFLHYERQYESHFIPTPDGGRQYACLWKTFGHKCPVCEWLNVHGRTRDPEGQMKAKRRHLWLVRDRDEKGTKIRIFDTNHWNRGLWFGEMMADKINLKEKYRQFARPVGGYTLTLTVKEQSMGGGRKYNAVTMIDFEKRDDDYPETITDDMPCLDDCIIPAMPKELAKSGKSPYDFTDEEWEQCYHELNRIFQQGTPNGDDDEPGNGGATDDDAPSSRRSRDDLDDDSPRQQRRQEKEPDDEPAPSRRGSTNGKEEHTDIKKGSKVTHRRWGKCEVMHVGSDGTLRIEDADGMSHANILPSDVEVTTSTKGDEKDSKEDHPSGRKSSADDDDGDRDEDLVEDDEPQPARRRGRR